jgi:hypothetical protein
VAASAKITNILFIVLFLTKVKPNDMDIGVCEDGRGWGKWRL